MNKILVAAILALLAALTAGAQPSYNTVSDMLTAVTKPVTFRTGTTLQTLGYNVARDTGDPLIWSWDSTNTLATNRFRLQVGTNTTGRLVHAWSGDVRVFGAKGDGATDDTTALNTAFAFPSANYIIPKTTAYYLISSQLVFTNSNATIDWYGRVRTANGVNYHITSFGANPSFDGNGRPLTVLSNLTINGHGIGELDGNSLNAVEYFPVSTSTPYGGHGLYLIGWENLSVSGMLIRDIPNWAFVVQRCNNVHLFDNSVLTGFGNNSTNWNGKNQDGIHLVDTWDAVVNGNWVHSSDDNYAVTTAAGNSENVIFDGNVGVHNFLSSSSFQAGGTYYVLGMNGRVTNEGSQTNYVRNVTYSDNDFYGGNGGLQMQNNGSASNQIRNIKVVNNRFHSKTNVGNSAYKGQYSIILSRGYDVDISGNQFHTLARTFYIQDCNLLRVRDNEWTDEVINSFNIATIYLDGSNAANLSTDIEFSGNRFYNAYYSPIRIEGLKSGVRMYENVSVSGNRVVGGPQDANRIAFQLNGVTGRLKVDGNEFHSWNGGSTIYVLNPDGRVSINGNGFFNAETATAAATFVSTTNGFLIPLVEFKNNVLFRHGQNIDLRNIECVEIEGNDIQHANIANPSQDSIKLQFTGDGGSNPSMANFRGRFQNNFVYGTNSAAKAFSVSYTSMPTFTGSPLYAKGNRIVGFTTPYSSANLTVFPDYETFEQRPMYTTTGHPTFGSYFRYPDSTLSANSSAFFVERVSSGAGLQANAVNAANILHRFQGSSSNYTTVSALDVTASQDRAAYVDIIRGVNTLARWTSTGNTREVSSVFANISGTGAGAASQAYHFRSGNPSLSGGSTIGEAGGLLIEEITSASITNKYGIRQLGTTMTNNFAGPIQLGGVGSYPFIMTGTGDPTTNLLSTNAPNGSLWLRQGSVNDPLWIRSNGVWVVK